MIGQLLRDAKHGVRSLVRTPGFTMVTVLTLALAIGANAAIFSVVNGILLEPLPFPDSDRLMAVRSEAPGVEAPDDFSVSPEFELLYGEAAAIEDLGLYNTFGGTIRIDGVAERIPMASVTGSLFTTLGVEPLMGRLAAEDEMLSDLPQRPAILSYASWQTRYGADPGIVGRTADIAGAQRNVIGVMGPDFRFPTDETEIWIPFQQDPDNPTIGDFTWDMVARVQAGVDEDALVGQLAPLVERLKEDYAGASQYVAFLEQGRYGPVIRPLKERLIGTLDQPLWILLGTVVVVLLIACANVANLFLVRGEAKQRDMAVRAALGSGRTRLIRASMVEAALLALAGGFVGTLLAWAGIPLLLQAAPESIPRLSQVGLDFTALAYTAGISLVAALLFGLFPALRYTAPGLLGRLRYAGRGAASGPDRHLARNTLVVFQSAMALVLLVGSGLLVRSFSALMDADPGFEAEDVLTFQYALPGERYPTAEGNAAFHTRFMDELRGLPGVRAVGAVGNVPIDEGFTGRGFDVEGQASTTGMPTMLYFTYASPGYFEAMDIRVEAGRAFTNSDHESPWGAVVVSRAVADELWPGQDPIGKRLRAAADSSGWDTVVGVVEDVRAQGLRVDPPQLIYLPFVDRADAPGWVVSSPGFMVKASNPESLIPPIRDRLRAMDATLPMYRIQTMEQIVSDSVARLSFTMLTLGIAATMALILGAIGLYGVLSYLVTQRTQEIGVRLALGAERAQVRRMVVGQGARLAGLGLLAGLLGAAGLTRLLQGLLYGTEPVDAATFVAMSVLMLGVGLVASYVPARRASTVDPIESMRLE